MFDELQLGTGFVSRQFSYHAGEVTDEHKENSKLKSTATTQLVSQIVLSDGRTLSYEYDKEERITKVTDSIEGTTEYTYDALGQLLTEKRDDVVVNEMVYDNYGNIVSKNGKTYAYDLTWKDLLTSFDGQSITYDSQGNPTSYLGHTLTWEKGRQLKQIDNIEYTYNANGIRTSKTVNGVLHTYTLDGTKILRETWRDNTLVPLYDNEDSVCGIIYNDDVPYYFIKNLQGDVIAIVNKDAETVARYSYDAWGVPTILQDTSGCDIANINPFRYRSYIYDEEIGLYYVSSRYYDSEIGRWINADEATYLGSNESLLSCNLNSYCMNSSIVHSDPDGHDAVVLLYSKAAKGFGHMSIIFQDYYGIWWYFYWGAATQGLGMYIGMNVKSYSKLDCLYTKGNYFKFFSSTRQFLLNRDIFRERITRKRQGIRYESGLTNALYLLGDFSYCLNYFLEQIGKKYNLYKKNCMQVVMAGLTTGVFYKYRNSSDKNTSLIKYIKGLSKQLIPNSVYKQLVRRIKKEDVGFESEGKVR